MTGPTKGPETVGGAVSGAVGGAVQNAVGGITAAVSGHVKLLIGALALAVLQPLGFGIANLGLTTAETNDTQQQVQQVDKDVEHLVSLMEAEAKRVEETRQMVQRFYDARGAEGLKPITPTPTPSPVPVPAR